MFTFSQISLNYPISPMDIYVPPLVPIVQLWPAKTYQPPLCSSNVVLWSEVHLHALANVTQITQKILPQGWRQGNLWHDGSFIVALRRRYVREANRILDRGAWVCPRLGIWGENVVELYAFVHMRPYSDAIRTLANEGRLTGSNKAGYPQNQVRDWRQNRNPLSADLAAYCLPSCYPSDSEIQVYNNVDGHPILQAIRLRHANGENVCVYRSLLSYREGPEYQWAEIYPQAPFPIFNVDTTQHRLSRQVFLVEDEFLAARWGLANQVNAFIAVPAGLKNLLNADLAPLRGRQILVVLGQRDLAEGYRIQHALQTAQFTDAQFSVDQGKTFKPFSELERIAAQQRVELLPLPFERRASPQTQLVIVAGEKIPGGDAVGPYLMYPIIRAGEIIWLYADSKSYKTWLALSIAEAVARGNSKIASWNTNDPAGVLYVDGEMKAGQLQEAISMIMVGAGYPAGAAPFNIICAQTIDGGLVDITLPETQAEIVKTIMEKKLKLLILDNIQALTSNKPSAVNQLFPWFRKLARAGIAVIIVDHTNGDGDVQGSSAKERVPDLLISLSRSHAGAKSDGRIQVEFPYARRLHGADAEPFQLQTVFTDNTFKFEAIRSEENILAVSQSKVMEKVLRMALVYFARNIEKISYPEISKKYGIAQSTAHGYYQEAATLVGDEKAVFDRELECLIAKRGPFTSQ